MVSATTVRNDLHYLASRHRIAPFTLHRPTSATDAAEILERYGPRAALMGGGVDLSNRLKRGERIDHVVYLRTAPDLCGIEPRGALLRVGAAVTHQQLAEDPAFRRALPDLAAVWRTLGNPRVRAAGTIGGNLVTGAPHYDVPPLVAAVSARRTYHRDSQRLLSHLDFPIEGRLTLRYEASFKPVASVAVAAREIEGRWHGRAVVGCAYPELEIATFDAQADLSALTEASADLAAAVTGELPGPVDDHVASASYRRRLIEVLLRRLLADIGSRQGERSGAVSGAEVPVAVTVNGDAVATRVPAQQVLADFLADHGVCSVRISCDQGVCGACTVLVDGRPTASCATFVFQVDGCEVVTSEGLGDSDDLDPVQQAFVDNFALQCGYCTSGMVLTAAALLEGESDPSPEVVRRWMAGNVCRCTGYESIVAAVTDAAHRRQRTRERS